MINRVKNSHLDKNNRGNKIINYHSTYSPVSKSSSILHQLSFFSSDLLAIGIFANSLFHKTKTRKAQIWLETAVYTLIGLALIGMVLAFATPKIQASQEKALIEQAINSLENFDSLFNEIINSGSGNRRTYETLFKKGELSIDGENDIILFNFETKTAYSQPNLTIKNGAVSILTLKKQKGYTTELKLNYSGQADIVVSGKQESKKYDSAPTSYTLLLTNNGISSPNRRVVIDVESIRKVSSGAGTGYASP